MKLAFFIFIATFIMSGNEADANSPLEDVLIYKNNSCASCLMLKGRSLANHIKLDHLDLGFACSGCGKNFIDQNHSCQLAKDSNPLLEAVLTSRLHKERQKSPVFVRCVCGMCRRSQDNCALNMMLTFN